VGQREKTEKTKYSVLTWHNKLGSFLNVFID